MWRKNMRSHQSLIYRKKYKCPVCNEYSLHIIHDLVCECENECDVDYCDKMEIESIISKNNFEGYYTLQDIDNLFYEIDNDSVNRMFRKITDDPLLKGMSDKQKKEIENLFAKTIEIDSQLDDITVKYMNKYKIKESDKLSTFSYVINLLEDIHHFLNLAWNDVCLFYYGSNLVKEKFYSERFFFDNCVDHISLATERIYVFLGIYYDFNFDSNLSNNRTINIKKYLKKHSDFKGTKIKSLIDCASGSSIIKDIRGYNIHDLSYLNNKIVKDIEKDPNKADYYNADSTDINKLELKIELPKILKTIKQYYDVLFEAIQMMNNNSFNHKNIPMLEIFWNDIVNSKPVETQYSVNFCNDLNIELSAVFAQLQLVESKYNIDVFFRINDIVHCINDIFNIEAKHYFNKYHIDVRESSFILQADKQYLLHSSVIRLYACYDKLSKYLNLIDKRYVNIQYFSDFNTFSFLENNVHDKKIRTIVDNEFYQKLEKLRNDIYHSLRPGCMGGKDAMNHFNNIIGQVVFENTKIVLAFLEFIIENNLRKRGNI